MFGNKEQQITPLGNSTANLELSKMVMRMWTSFAHDLDPNGHGGAPLTNEHRQAELTFESFGHSSMADLRS